MKITFKGLFQRFEVFSKQYSSLCQKVFIHYDNNALIRIQNIYHIYFEYEFYVLTFKITRTSHIFHDSKNDLVMWEDEYN